MSAAFRSAGVFSTNQFLLHTFEFLGEVNIFTHVVELLFNLQKSLQFFVLRALNVLSTNLSPEFLFFIIEINTLFRISNALTESLVIRRITAFQFLHLICAPHLSSY
jgi:hypothetical protein